MIFKRCKDTARVKTGARFQRVRRDHTVETARVLSIASDPFGIPHVRFELSLERPRSLKSYVDGQRVLALNSFAEMYQDSMAS